MVPHHVNFEIHVSAVEKMTRFYEKCFRLENRSSCWADRLLVIQAVPIDPVGMLIGLVKLVHVVYSRDQLDHYSSRLS